MPARKAPILVLLGVATFAAGLIVSGALKVTPASEAHSAGNAPGGSASAGPASASAPTLPRTMTIPSFADIAAAALPAVVSIASTGVVSEDQQQSQGVDPFEFFFGPRGRGNSPRQRQRRAVAAGSGFVISDSGWVLTNNHVVNGASKIQVTLRDREVFSAKVVGADPSIDVALLKIDANHKLPALALGDSEKMRVGDPVMAIGNPLQFAGTVTVGVLSAKGRTGISDNVTSASLQDLLQTDAAINFGNSGGPLLNTNAEVIGINTAMIQPAQNIGFAVAIDSVKAILPQLEKSGKVERGMLGVRIGPVDQDIQKAFKLPSMDGAFVESVEPGKPAERAGVKPGDAIVQVDNVVVHEPRELINYVSSRPPGQAVRLTVVRNGQRQTLSATLARLDVGETASEASPASERPGRQERLGISVAALTSEIRQELNVPANVSGVVVADVRDGSPAGDQGMAPGDVITEANGAKVTSIEEFRSAMARVGRGDYVRLYVRRFSPQEASRFVIIKTE
ncbi:MAG TPA: Do family serine endopeptidase [Thermoanaerobaculia bacterium]|nr:Do family serine endopeptidase [Thermoanaerobaculia bacterium]